MRLYDTAGLPPLSGPNAGTSTQQQQQQQQLAKQLLGLTEGYVLVYDPARPESFECLLPLKRDIDKNRDKKEVSEYFPCLLFDFLLQNHQIVRQNINLLSFGIICR